MTWVLSGFADEAASDFGEQLALMTRLGLRYIELRSAWGVKVLDLDETQRDEAQRLLDAAGIGVSSIGSDLGKIAITDDFEPHLQRAAHAMYVARFFDTRFVRVFSFFLPPDADASVFRDEVLRRTRALVKLAEASGATLLHENEKHIYGDTPERVADLLATIDSPHYRGVFDPANYVQCGVRPFDEAYPLVREFTDYLHIKDASATRLVNGLNEVLPAGEGDGQVREIVRALAASGFEGFFSLEPHLGDFDAFGGRCGPELWTRAHTAFTDLLRSEGLAWR